MLYIENSDSDTPLIGGSFSGNRVGINTAAANLTSGATLQVGGDLSVLNGTNINEFSTDIMLADGSNMAIPTEGAVKAYVDNSISSFAVVISTDGTLLDESISDVPSESAVKTYVDNSISSSAVVISTDGTLLDESISDVPSESAVKTYVDNSIASSAVVISTDGTLFDESISEVPTEGAVKAYVDNSISSSAVVISTDGTLLDESISEIPSESAIKTYVDINAPKLVKTSSGMDNYHSNLNNMPNVTSAEGNLAIGDYSLHNVSNGSFNIGVGINSLKANTTGVANLAMGYNALRDNTTGKFNVVFGGNAGRHLNGSSNTMVGYGSGVIASGSNNVFLGTNAGGSSDASSSVFIGHNAGYNVDNSNALVIENKSGTASSKSLISGNFSTDRVGINRSVSNLSGGATLQVGGTISNSDGLINVNSDRRLKTNITSLNSIDVLDKMLALKGVSYQWNDTVTGYVRKEGIQYGFVAQNIEQVWPSKISKDGKGYLTTAYGDYDPMFVESIRALNNKIEDLTSQLNTERMSFEEENKLLKAQLESKDLILEKKQREMQSQLDQLKAMLIDSTPELKASAK